MDITKRPSGSKLELAVKGRLDAYWADHLSKELAEAVRGGAHHLILNLAGVDYLSSAGLRVFILCRKQLIGIQGSLSISHPSPPVKTVMALAGLDAFFTMEAVPTESLPAEEPRMTGLDLERGTCEVFDGTAGATLTCRAIGDPELLIGARFREEHCWNIVVPDSAFAVGLGAFGQNFEDCRNRFGEWLAVGGAAAYQPTDGTTVADYLLATGAYRPESKLLYGLACEGAFAHLVRFEAKPESGTLRLTEILAACLEIAQADMAGLVMIAEAATLMGASLKRSPARQAAEGVPFTHPEIRDWLSFTPEGAHPRSLALVVGVAARADCPELAPFVRPLGRDTALTGHLHAAAFAYRPIKKGLLDLHETVAMLFEAEAPEGLLHLVNDDRPVTGAGQSEFVRGACWLGPIAHLAAEGVPA